MVMLREILWNGIYNLIIRIVMAKSELNTIDKSINELKRKAKNSAAVRAKKLKAIDEGRLLITNLGIFYKYDTVGRPHILNKFPNLNESIVNDADPDAEANDRRRRTQLDVRTVVHLKEQLRENNNIDLAESTLRSYLKPRNPNSIQAKRHHTPAPVKVSTVHRSEMKVT
jgi:hypothetical protein